MHMINNDRKLVWKHGKWRFCQKILVDEQCTGDKGTSLVHSNSCIVTCAISLIYLKSNLALSSLSTYPYL